MALRAGRIQITRLRLVDCFGQTLDLAGSSDQTSADPAVADMSSVVIVGSASTRIIAGRMVTRRGYRWQP